MSIHVFYHCYCSYFRETLSKIVAECQEHVEWMLQLSTMSSYSAMHLHSLLLHQVLHEVWKNFSIQKYLYICVVVNVYAQVYMCMGVYMCMCIPVYVCVCVCMVHYVFL